ncbi:MAG: hypothetical protein F6K62_25645, partial [Sphaerospermopsis sp. SIO1G2]|nr:hypothetical protein [Sphaerospermopsis sp. SIO1G2]
MNSQFTDWDQDLPPEKYEEYQTLINTLKLKNQNEFGLFFVECISIEEEVLLRIIKDIPDKKIEFLHLVNPTYTLYEQVLNLYKNKNFDILFIQGLELSLYQYEQE